MERNDMAISFFKKAKVAKTAQPGNLPAGIQTGFAGSTFPLTDLSVKRGYPKLDTHMVQFTASIQQFAEKGEKTGWTYVEIPADIAQQLQPGSRKSFRVKGKLDDHPITGVALVPMGGGIYILALNAAMRKALHKKKGAMLTLRLSIDKQDLTIPPELLECLEDEPSAKAFFDTLKPSHRNYFIKWIGGVKSDTAVAKRIAQVVTAMNRKQDFVTMVRSHKAERDQRR